MLGATPSSSIEGLWRDNLLFIKRIALKVSYRLQPIFLYCTAVKNFRLKATVDNLSVTTFCTKDLLYFWLFPSLFVDIVAKVLQVQTSIMPLRPRCLSS